MEEIPSPLFNSLSPADQQAVVAWWTGLGEGTRQEIVVLWDERQDRCFFGMAREDCDEAVPVVIGGQFVPSDDAAGWAEWHAEYFDYLINHPELMFLEPPGVRIFYIGCTRHEAARAVLATGRIPADFKCPLDSPECPMRKLLSALIGLNRGRGKCSS